MNAVAASELVLDDLVDPRERLLGGITLVLGIVLWLGIVAGTIGIALVILAIGGLLYLFAHSALIAHVKGNGVEVTAEQFPDVHAQLVECCRLLQMNKLPQTYILNGNGVLNAFATHFLRTEYVILTSDVVDAMHSSAEGMRFYIGHECGHLRMKHLSGQLLRAPVLWLPLLGAAYSRARERTCDRHGAACSDTGLQPQDTAALHPHHPFGQRWRDRLRPPSGLWVPCQPDGCGGGPSTCPPTYARPRMPAASGCPSTSWCPAIPG